MPVPLCSPYQTIVYHKPTGRIITSLPNRYIRRRADLRLIAPDTALVEVAFFYEPADIAIDLINDHIKQIASGTPPHVFSQWGECKSFSAFLKARKLAISHAQKILVLFEGGMGDQILQAEAILQFIQENPKKEIFVSPPDKYYDVLALATGLPPLERRGTNQHQPKPDIIIDNHTSFISDPRGKLYGKASLYGASLGLDSVSQKAQILLNPQIAHEAAKKIFQDRPWFTDLLIGIHIRSGSGHAKSWNTEPAETLARLLIEKLSAKILLFGETRDWQINSPDCLRVGPPATWFETTCAISKLAFLVCVDSGPMHLARALGRPHITLWGGTSSRDILGREPGPTDLRQALPCMTRICYNCAKGNPLCMAAHSVDDIFSSISKRIQSPPATKEQQTHASA